MQLLAAGTAVSYTHLDVYKRQIVRRIDDLGRVVIPKEIRRTMRIREGDPLQTTLKSELDYLLVLLRLADRLYIK